MNRMELLAKLIVPIFFLAVWALNQIFSKEGQAGPRTAAPFEPPQPDRGPVRPDDSRPAIDPFGDASNASRGRPPARPAPQSSEIFIIGPETGAQVRGAPAGQRGRGAGARGRRPAGAKPESEAKRPRKILGEPMTSGVSQSIVQRPLGMQDLATTRHADDPSAPQSTRAERAAATAKLDPQRLRDAVLLSEILGPPVSRRRRS